MEEVIVFGHKSPDTDTICSAIVMADLQTKIRGKKVIPCRLGEINEETKFALKKFNAEAPKFIEKVEEGQKVILVDHNEFSQSVEGIENAKIEAVVDHHRINNFETSEPLFYYAQPVGCTSTILFELYSSNNIEIPAQMAGLMLSAIISDTLLLKSPTTTEKDKKALEALAKIADVDVNIYGLEMLKAGTNLDKYTEDELDVKATIRTEGNTQVAEISTNINGNIYRAVSEQKDLYASIDKDIDIVEGQIRKMKTKKEKQMTSESIKDYEIISFNEDSHQVEKEVLKTQYYEVRPMSVEDAKLKLQDSKNMFLTFVNADTEEVNVIFKLKDGVNFGLVEPE